MKRLFSSLLWSLVFLLIVVGLDQVLVRVEMNQPVLAEIRTFYVDFRARLLHLAEGLPAPGAPGSKTLSWPLAPNSPLMVTTPVVHPPAASRDRQTKPEASPSRTAISERTPRFLYTDDKGGLHFADRLEDIPTAYRDAAQPFAR